jgi:hypothetical protein
MKRILLILALAMTVILSSCVKPEEPTEIHFSILGDSYSTFEGYVDPETNDVWQHYANIGVTKVEQMWWHKIATEMGWVLDKNNSFSGALICNFSDFEDGDYYGHHSFLKRMNDLGNSDVIFILGGTNDVWQDAPFGDYVDVDWTEEQLCSFRPALAYLLSNMKRLYPNSKLYFLLETDPCPGGITEETRLNLIESVHRITSSYDVECIDLTIHKDWWHPDAQGQNDIARQTLEVLMADFNANV